MKVTLTDNRAKVHALIDQAPNGYVVEIKEQNRTHEQNALYWAAVHEIAESIFLQDKKFTPQVWHIYFKQRFLPGKMVELPNGQLLETEPTTTDLTKPEFSDFVTQVLQFQEENR
jgi:hypothetical protein